MFLAGRQVRSPRILRGESGEADPLLLALAALVVAITLLVVIVAVLVSPVWWLMLLFPAGLATWTVFEMRRTQ